MPLLKGDIRFARSANMADVPEGGGPPSAQLLTSGRSNEIFPDISEETRTVGRVEIYQIFGVLRNTDRAALMGSNVILAQPPADPNVSITLLSLKNPFATRAEIARRIESGMSAGSEWGGYLLENHYTTMRSLQVLQRPGSTPPTQGKTYVLVYQEGQSGDRRQRIRIKNTSTETRTFTQIVNGQLTDFAAQVTTCELFDGLLYDFPGSTASRYYARDPAKTLIRETVYSDSGMFYSAGRLTAATQINDAWLQVDSVYTQVVPNSRSEVASVDQRPTARQTLTLAQAPRLVEVGVTPHTQRIRVAEENSGMVFVAQLKPAPAPGTVYVDFWSLGQRYTLVDDGAGQLKGQGSGTVDYLTGALSMTLKNPPDVGSSINISHGENTAYTNRSGQAGFRAPEFAWAMPHQGIKPGSVVVTWMSGGALKTATDNGTGGFTGHATGEIDYAAGKIYLRPTAMIDAGGEFQTAYEYSSTRTENFAAPAVDAGGFGSIVLAEVPAARSVTVRWITVRNVSASSGTSEIVSSSGTAATTVVVTKPQTPGNTLTASKAYAMPGQDVTFDLSIVAPQTVGTYTWRVEASTLSGVETDDALVLGGATTGTFTVAAPAQQLGGGGAMATPPVGNGSFTLTIAAGCPDLKFSVVVSNQALTAVAMSPAIVVDAVGDQPAPPWETTPPRPAIKTREPIKTALQQGDTSQTISGMYLGGVDTAGGRVYVSVQPSNTQIYGQHFPYYDPPASEAELWTAAELAYGKQMTSLNGATTTYQLWK